MEIKVYIFFPWYSYIRIRIERERDKKKYSATNFPTFYLFE